MLLSKLWCKTWSKFQWHGENIHTFIFCKKQLHAKTLRHYNWELEETLQRKCLRNVWTPWAMENALGSYGITIELGEHNHVIAILRYMTILKSEKQANKWEHTPKGQKPKGIVGSKGQWNIDYFGRYQTSLSKVQIVVCLDRLLLNISPIFT